MLSQLVSSRRIARQFKLDRPWEAIGAVGARALCKILHLDRPCGVGQTEVLNSAAAAPEPYPEHFHKLISDKPFAAATRASGSITRSLRGIVS